MPSDFEIIERKKFYVQDRPVIDPKRYTHRSEDFVSFRGSSSQRSFAFIEALRDVQATPSRESTLAEAFRSLAQSWYEETAFESSFTKIVMNLNYLRIISLGQPVVGLILEELERKSAPWFLALKAITGFDPVPDRYAGDFKAMTEAWLEWGRARKLV